MIVIEILIGVLAVFIVGFVVGWKSKNIPRPVVNIDPSWRLVESRNGTELYKRQKKSGIFQYKVKHFASLKK